MSEMDQCRCPHGDEGKKTLASMNEEHREQIQWGIDNLPDIAPKTILDIGCGGGIFTRMILEKYPEAKACALDISELAVEHAKEFNKDLIGAGRLEIVVGNVEKMPYKDGQFDLVVSNASHFFWPDLKQNLKEVSRTIAENGVLCLTCGVHFEHRPEEQHEGFNAVADDEMIGYMRGAGLEAQYFVKPNSKKCTFIGVKGDFGGIRAKIRHGWNLSAEGYSRNLVQTDFTGPGAEYWTDAILSQAPKGKLKVLDVGTGPGVFATLMARAGHDSYGIDVSDEMIRVATKNAADHGTSPVFKRMDSEKTDFEDGTFDLIVNRNVFWIMPDPMAVYREWFRILKHGGRVVYFDGGHEERAPDFDIEGLDRKMMIDNDCARLSFKKEDFMEARGWKKELPLSYPARPKWDLDNIVKVGFKVIGCEEIKRPDIDTHSGHPADEDDKEMKQGYGPMFRMVAEKP